MRQRGVTGMPTRAGRNIHVGQYNYEAFATPLDSALVTQCDRRVWVGCDKRIRPVQSRRSC